MLVLGLREFYGFPDRSGVENKVGFHSDPRRKRETNAYDFKPWKELLSSAGKLFELVGVLSVGVASHR